MDVSALQDVEQDAHADLRVASAEQRAEIVTRMGHSV